MKTMKRALAVLLGAVLLCVGVPLAAADDATVFDSGYCGAEGDGTNLIWTLYSDGKLTISGSGPMQNSQAWSSYRNEIESVSIGSGVTSIGRSAFYGCDNLTSVTIPDSVTSIGKDAFIKCNGLTSLTIPDSVMSIGNAAFSECDNLKTVKIGDGLTTIPPEAFYRCKKLESVTIGRNVESIGEHAFYFCPVLKSVNFGNSLKTICRVAFSGCFSLEKFTIPETVITIEEKAFELTNEINVDENNLYYSSEDGVLFNKEKTELIQYPMANPRTKYTVPETVKTICSEAFNLSTLSEIVLPNNLSKIESKAFDSSLLLDEITVKSLDTILEEQSVGVCGALINNVPDELKRDFILSLLWETPLNDSIKPYYDNWEDYLETPDYENGETFFINGTILCHAGSTAEAYAQELGMDYEPVHFYDTFVSTTEPTCTKQGFSTYQCIYCEATEEKDYVDPLGHDPKIGDPVPPTCTEEGYAPFICTRCGETTSISDLVPALKHDYNIVYTWAKDDSTVTAEKVCSRCGDVALKEVADVTAEVTVKPTCSTEGELTLTAAFNNKAFYAQTKTKVLPMDPDAHVFRVTVTPPTCVDDGYTTHACTLCRYGYSDSIVPALGHDYQKHSPKAPTCKETGWEAYETCSRCDYTTYQELATVDHTDVDNDGKCDFCNGQMTGGDHCKVCGKIHNGNFFDKLTGFFHRIIGIFKR